MSWFFGFLRPGWRNLFVGFLLVSMFLVLQNACHLMGFSCYVNEYFLPSDSFVFFLVDMVLFLPFVLSFWGVLGAVSGNGMWLFVVFLLVAYVHVCCISFVIERFVKSNSFREGFLGRPLFVFLFPFFEWLAGLSLFVGISLILFHMVPSYVVLAPVFLVVAYLLLLASVGIVGLLHFFLKRLNRPRLEFILISLVLFSLYFCVRFSRIGLLPSWVWYD
ncbi:MAG: hypothetical protein JW744_04180 [Candidatus Diapherotrites archaeon]|uniref:Uncharacterized protein n=1 Tax=Candidatus Iainarchaeum sp. TaxID=3101447 RepID=A0A939C7G7_9ARCH|nr:hypothetical protein [Candidatus Diapherotrites archaeon]